MGSIVVRGKAVTATARLPDDFKGPAQSRSISKTWRGKGAKTAAKTWLHATESAMKLGTWQDPRLEPKAYGPLGWPDKPLKDAFDSYRETRTPSKKGASQEAAMLRMLARTEIAKRRIRDLMPSDFVEWASSRLAEGLSESTVRNNLNTISAVYRWLINLKGVAIQNPIKAVRDEGLMPQPGDGRERRLKPGEEAAIKDAIAAMAGPVGRQWTVLFPLLLETGMRLGEALSLRVAWLRQEYGFLVIPRRHSKGGEPRYVALSNATFDMLLSFVEGEDEEGRVFRFTEQDAKNAWRYKIRPAAQCVGLNIHDLRHEALSRMAARGANLKILMRQSGHKTVAVLMRYLNPTPAEQRAALFPDDVTLPVAA